MQMSARLNRAPGMQGGVETFDATAPKVPSMLEEMAPTTPTDSAVCAGNEPVLNFYFRGGDEEHCFAFGGQRAVPEWKDRSEADVLIERAEAKVKPVASIVLKNYARAERFEILKRCRHMHRRVTRNEWKVYELRVTARPDASLYTLLKERGAEGECFVRSGRFEWLRSATVRTYVNDGFDCSGKRHRVSVLVSALLLGYPLDLAKFACGFA